MAGIGAQLKILFLVTQDFSFWSRRLFLARKLRDLGVEVWVMTCAEGFAEALRQEGFKIVPWNVSRRSMNPLREAYAFLQVVRAYRTIAPDLVHHFALKPIIYGGLAARHCGEISTVNSVVGLGHAFTNESTHMRIVRRFLLLLLRLALKRNDSKVIFQNPDNLQEIIQAGTVRRDQCILIRGSGVNAEQFFPQPEPGGVPVVVLASRMLWEKGIREFVQAAELLRGKGITARFVLVGDPDDANVSSIPVSQLRAWADAGAIEWRGHRDDMPAVFAEANLVCLPSYGEGVPRSLIEAAACGRAIVASDVPGCREVVRHGENGLLVPARDSRTLANALATLIEDSALRAKMGARGRVIFLREFSEEIVLEQTLTVYRDLLGSRWPDASRHPLSALATIIR